MKNIMGIGLAVALTAATTLSARVEDKFTIALIPGLTTDAFYITMHKGAEAAAKDSVSICSIRALPSGMSPRRSRC